MKTILAAPNLLKIENIALYPAEVRLVVKSKPKKSPCPSCSLQSAKVHSRYKRHLTDLPWEGIAVRLILSVRKFFCLNPECDQRIFCERLPELAAPYAHKTMRLNELLTALGLALGGRPGMRLARGLGLQVSHDAVLARIRRADVASTEKVRVLGVDDFAFRKGRSYGTILVDQQRHRTIDLLPDREASSLAAWLKNHPEIEIVTRDRGQAYADGIRQGAPQAVQIADRFHLLQNLTDALKRLATRKSRKLQQALGGSAQTGQESEPEISDQHLHVETRRQSQRDLDRAASRERRYQLYLKVKELAVRGLPTNQIARILRIHWLTAQRYATAEGFPERARRQGDRSPIGSWQRFGSEFSTSLIFYDPSPKNSTWPCKICKGLTRSNEVNIAALISGTSLAGGDLVPASCDTCFQRMAHIRAQPRTPPIAHSDSSARAA